MCAIVIKLSKHLYHTLLSVCRYVTLFHIHLENRLLNFDWSGHPLAQSIESIRRGWRAPAHLYANLTLLQEHKQDGNAALGFHVIDGPDCEILW